MWLMLACTAPEDSDAKDTSDTAVDTADSADTAETADTGETADSGETAETGETDDSGSAAPAVLLPLYVYPSAGAWDSVKTAAAAHPGSRLYAIVNVNSSPYVGGPDVPGTSTEPSYAAELPGLVASGAVVLGYVPTGYGARDLNDVAAMCAAWPALYPGVAGIFLDEMASDAASVAYYNQLATRIAAVGGLDTVVANPGVSPDAAYAGLFDTLVVYESPGLPTLSTLPAAIPAAERAVIPYEVTSFDPAWLADARAATGMIYVTDDVLPNPWDTVSPYLDALLTP